jgi:two-component system, cell cycle sensor histidine kinase and response regulator CckA
VLAKSTVPVDLLLTDVVMPEMSGRQLAEQASVLRPALPVMFMSGYAFGAFGENAPAGEPVILLAKPFTPAALLAHVARALAQRAPTAAP